MKSLPSQGRVQSSANKLKRQTASRRRKFTVQKRASTQHSKAMEQDFSKVGVQSMKAEHARLHCSALGTEAWKG